MFIQRFKSKIHRATITEANLNYVGSITIDEDLLDAANIQDGELVQVVNINNGERLETYVIPGKRGSGTVCLNGAAARKAQDRKSTRLNSSHVAISYAVFCLTKRTDVIYGYQTI